MNHKLRLRPLGIDTYNEPVVYMRKDCHICLSEGFEVHARVRVSLGNHSIIATLNTIATTILKDGEASLSQYAWRFLEAKAGDEITVIHAKPVTSMSYVRSKIYGHPLDGLQFKEIVGDVIAGRYSDIEISAFLTACAGNRMNEEEIFYLTKSMVGAGSIIQWDKKLIVDKHCVGGLPGNRTTPIVVAIVAASGLTIPKTSSRAITSPAGTADTMEVLAPVELTLEEMRRVVARENGCVVWGGAVSLSPADDILIRVEKALDLDSEGQLVASILSKKIAAGSTHVLIDIPIGPTAKVRSEAMGNLLAAYLQGVAKRLGLKLTTHFSNGSEPIGFGIGPALEAQDIVSVLQNLPEAPTDLRERALTLSAKIMELASNKSSAAGFREAQDILDSGRAWRKFEAICTAQGGLREIPKAKYSHVHASSKRGKILSLDNRKLSKIAKLAGAPLDKTAGVKLLVKSGYRVEKGQPLFSVHAESKGELSYALSFIEEGNQIMQIEET